MTIRPQTTAIRCMRFIILYSRPTAIYHAAANSDKLKVAGQALVELNATECRRRSHGARRSRRYWRRLVFADYARCEYWSVARERSLLRRMDRHRGSRRASKRFESRARACDARLWSRM